MQPQQYHQRKPGQTQPCAWSVQVAESLSGAALGQACRGGAVLAWATDPAQIPALAALPIPALARAWASALPEAGQWSVLPLPRLRAPQSRRGSRFRWCWTLRISPPCSPLQLSGSFQNPSPAAPPPQGLLSRLSPRSDWRALPGPSPMHRGFPPAACFGGANPWPVPPPPH